MFYSFFLSIFFLLVYLFWFYVSADTPLKYSSFLDKLELIGLIVFLSALLAGFIKVILSVIKSLSGLKRTGVERAEYVCVLTILFFSFLLLAENWSYSVFGFGLKTSIAWWSKLLFSGVAIFLSFQFSPLLIRLGQALSAKNTVVSMLVGILISVYLAVSLIRIVSGIDSERDSGKIKNRFNVIILSSDGVDASEMSVYGSEFDTTPFLKSIRSEFMVFENAYTNNQNSTGSVVSMLTGLSPLTTKVVYPPDILTGENSKRSLPRVLGRYGYYRSMWGVPHYVDADSQNIIGAFDSNNVRDAEAQSTDKPQESTLLERFIDKINVPSIQTWYLRSVTKDYSGVVSDVLFVSELDNPFLQVADKEHDTETSKPRINDESRINNLLQDIDIASQTQIPFFSFTHLMKTHGSKFRPRNQVFSRGQVEEKTWMIDFYRDAILEFDSKVSRVYERLKLTKQLDNTILIILSDHGKAWSNSKRIPLLIRWPNAENSGSHTVNVQLLDIAPTILDALGLRVPDWMKGQSLLQPENIRADRFILSAGVFGNHLSGGFWVRDSKGVSQFVSGNKFSVVHCDFFMKSAFPIDFSPVKLPDRQGESACSPLDIDTLKVKAEKLVTDRIN